MSSLDETFYLMGDEDTDVGIRCRICDRGGLPIAMYHVGSPMQPYEDVVIVNTIVGLIIEAKKHQVEKHSLL